MGKTVSDAECDARIDAHVAAIRHNAAITKSRRLRGGPHTEHAPGHEQRRALQFIRERPRTFAEIRALVPLGRTRAIFVLGGLAARDLIERDGGAWRAVTQERAR